MAKIKDQIGKSKLYYSNYLPGSIIRLRNNAFAQVIGTRSNNIEKDNISKEQLIEVAKQFIIDWDVYSDTSYDPGLLEAIEKQTIVIDSPKSLYVKAYPNVLRCSVCGRLDNYKARYENQRREYLEEIVKRNEKRNYIPCKKNRCNGHMLQLGLSTIHRCGSIQDIKFGYQAMNHDLSLKDINSIVHTSKLIDVNTGNVISQFHQGNCESCETAYPEKRYLNYRATRSSTGDTFYPQNVQYIALSQKYSHLIQRLREAPAIENDVTAGLLLSIINQIEHSDRYQKFDALFSNTGLNEQEIKQFKQEIEEKKEAIANVMKIPGLDEKTRGHLMDSTQLRVAELKAKLRAAEGAFPEIEDYISNKTNILSLLYSRRNFEAALLFADIDTYSMAKSIEDISELHEKTIETDKWIQIKESYGIEDIQHTNDLSVVLSSLGFTRERRKPDNDPDAVPIKLNGYIESSSDSSKGEYHIYAMSATTEGLVFRFSARKIVKWCMSNFNLNIPNPDILLDEKKCHAFLLESYPILCMEPKQVLEYSSQNPEHLTAPFNLIHSMAHSLIATAKQHSGYDEKSLVEYLLPANLGFVIYVTSVQNYTSGGLFNLFKYYLTNWFDDASLYSFNCMMDPVCSEEGGSCSSCLQQVLSCEMFNQGLSRSYIQGGVLNRDIPPIKDGFWTNNETG